MTHLAYGQTGHHLQEITYQAFTRGHKETIRISPDSLIREVEGMSGNSSSRTTLPEGAWTGLVESLQGVAIEKIGQLPAPTNNRQRDAALHTSITLRTADSTYTSAEFDDQNPPKALASLVQQIQGFTKKE